MSISTPYVIIPMFIFNLIAPIDSGDNSPFNLEKQLADMKMMATKSPEDSFLSRHSMFESNQDSNDSGMAFFQNFMGGGDAGFTSGPKALFGISSPGFSNAKSEPFSTPTKGDILLMPINYPPD